MKALAIFGRSREPCTYEVRLEVDLAIVSDFDEWLLEHVREMLAFPGFQSAEVFRSTDLTDEGRAVRVVVYRVRTRRELDSYLRVHAARMRDEGLKRFGKQFSASRRILPTAEHELPTGVAVLYDEDAISGGLPICGNCHRPVAGRFCMNCGQEDRTYLLSLHELFSEFFGELTNFDSRFFRSLRPLLFKPGWLTLEYIRGRRQNYFPPIRMYIIISLLFFFFTALLADGGLENVKLGDESVTGESTRESEADRREAIRELEDQLEDASGVRRRALELALTELKRRAAEAGEGSEEAERPAEEAAAPADESPPDTEQDVAIVQEQAAKDSETESEGFSWKLPSVNVDNGEVTASGWGSEELNERMARGARKITKSPGEFVKALIDNIPSMMFIFLPLIALALKALYLFSRRYYVEHLMFSLHFHSAVFLILLFWLLLREAANAWQPLDSVIGWVTAAVWIYVPVYLYKSMRRVYGQGHLMTSLKFFLLGICYIVAASVTSVLLFVAAVYQQA